MKLVIIPRDYNLMRIIPHVMERGVWYIIQISLGVGVNWLGSKGFRIGSW
jgi:hypothetical protein